jgi:hypothetical protein
MAGSPTAKPRESFRGWPLAPDADVDEPARQEVILAWPAGERRRLLQAEGPGLHLGKGESGLAELVELGKLSAGLGMIHL